MWLRSYGGPARPHQLGWNHRLNDVGAWISAFQIGGYPWPEFGCVWPGLDWYAVVMSLANWGSMHDRVRQRQYRHRRLIYVVLWCFWVCLQQQSRNRNILKQCSFIDDGAYPTWYLNYEGRKPSNPGKTSEIYHTYFNQEDLWSRID